MRYQEIQKQLDSDVTHTTTINIMEESILTFQWLKEKSIKHNHLPNFKSIHIAKIKEKIKRAARETDEITSLIILNAIPQLSKEALPRLLLS